jgi:hypothetical protein
MQYQKGFESQIILCETLLNFMYEAGDQPVHEHLAVNLSLYSCTLEERKLIFIFVF